MKYFICEFKKDYADEFDYSETFLQTELEWEEFKYFLSQFGGRETCYYFGTNEGWEDMTWNELAESISIKEISQSTYEELQGFISCEHVFNYDEDEEEWED